MKNFELAWARDWAGLTQAEVAERLGVHRDTVSRWETGVRPMPVRKWKLFQKLIEIDPKDIPKRLNYDAEGYPVRFDRSPFQGEANNGDWDLDGEELALEMIEGTEHLFRARERSRLRNLAFWTECGLAELVVERVVEAMATYDSETLRVYGEEGLKASLHLCM